MKSKMSKKLIAFILCMVLVICNSVSILADTPAPETATVEKQVKETKTANDKKASDDEAGDTENVSPQSEESAPEVKTTEKKEETTEATTQKKDEADEVTTKAKEETEKADETTTEAKETTKKEETTETQEEKTTKAKEETSETSGKKDTEKTTEAEEKTAPTELTYDDEDVTVTVSAVAEGAIPADATLKVVPILKDDTETKDQYTEVEQKIQEKAAETETEIKGFLAYDITFVDADGNEIEPNSEVKVSMEYKEAALPAEITAEDAKTSEVSVMHLEEDDAGNVSKVVDMGEAGKVDTLETTDAKQVEKVEVKTESFSAFTITWTYKNGNSLKIQAHYGYMENGSFVEFEESENYSGNNTSIDINWGSYHNINIDLNDYSNRLGDVTESYLLTNIKILNANGTEVRYLKIEREREGGGLFNPTYSYDLQSSEDGRRYNNVSGFTNMSGDEKLNVYYIFNLNPPGVTLTGHYGYLDGDTFVEFKTAENETTTKELKTLLFNNYDNSLTDLYDYQDYWSTITDDEYRFLGASLKSAKGQDAQYVKLNRTGNNNNRSYSVQSSMNSDSNFIDLNGYTGMSSSDEGRNLDVYYVFEKIDGTGSGGQGGDVEFPQELTKYKRAIRNEDGTYDLSLLISGSTGTITHKTKIDVVLVLDVSGSMKNTKKGSDEPKITQAAGAVETLINSLDSKETVDVRYNVVTFGTTASLLTGWLWDGQDVIEKVDDKADGMLSDSRYSQGTNYEAGLIAAQSQLDRVRSDTRSVVVFLTDGEPTYHVTSDGYNGRGDGTSIDTLNHAQNAASNIQASSFYVIGTDMDSHTIIYKYNSQYDTERYSGKDSVGNDISARGDGMSTQTLLDSLCTASDIEDSHVYNTNDNLSNVFGEIAENVTTIACDNVTVTDTLSEYAEPVEDNPTLWIKLYGKNARGEFDFSTPLESVEGSNPTLNYVGHETGNVQGVQATYTDGTITLDFPDDYELNPDYTYEVGIKIQPTDAAYTAYQNNNNSYPLGVIGETDTGTHSGDQGFYSNENATVTYDYTESDRDPAPEEFPKPVIQISEDKLDNLEPVNFYLNLSSTIADTSGEVENQEAKYFTESVSGKKSGINTDLVMKLPKTHNHKEIFDNQPVDENGNKIQVGVIAGNSNTSAKEVDEKIRQLENGTPGNQEGYNDPSELYQIVNAQKLGTFPDDGDIFEYIRTNWNTGYKVNKGQDITVNGIPIDVQNLTEKNFSIRWYVVKDDVEDCWHIDGVLVPKSGILNVTKTFSNQEIVNQLSDTFSVTVTGNFLDTENSTVRLPLNEAEKVTTNPDGSVTYTWPSLAVFGGEYKIAEEGYGNEELVKWEYVDTDYVYTNASNGKQEGKNISVTINTDKAEVDSTPKIQSFAFTNNYQLKTTNLDLVKTSKNSNEPITGAIFKLSKKVENGWVEVQSMVSVSGTGEPELQGLVTGQTYKLEEIQAPEAHMLLGEPIYFTVEDGTVKLCDENGVSNPGAGTDKMWSLNEEGNVLTIKNNILYDLPEAGGSGIYWYTFSGTLLMAGAALIVYREKRKREVLLRK